MKKLKTILALMLAIVIMCFSVTPAFATNTEKEDKVNVYKLLDELADYYSEYPDTFRLKLEQAPGSIPLDCYLDSASELIKVCDEFNAFYKEVIEGRVPTVAEINSFYPRLDAAAKKVILYRRELKYLIDHCSFETNDNAYYPHDLWKHFQDCLEKAVDVYEKGTEGIEVSQAYWNLKFAYNELCVINTISGDVDNSGCLTIFDVTLVQKHLAKMCNFNSSQLTVLDKSSKTDISIEDATKLQRVLAKLEEFNSEDLEILSANTSRMSLSDNWIFNSYRRDNYQGGIIICEKQNL